uniref:Uncharacterized protein n=1 Tax=Arundo donax TaxID=35708 RepID=A0A0A9CRR3_ARUDO
MILVSAEALEVYATKYVTHPRMILVLKNTVWSAFVSYVLYSVHTEIYSLF